MVLSKEREQRPMLKAYRSTARDRPAHIGPRDARHGGGGGGDRQTCTGSLKRRQAVNISVADAAGRLLDWDVCQQETSSPCILFVDGFFCFFSALTRREESKWARESLSVQPAAFSCGDGAWVACDSHHSGVGQLQECAFSTCMWVSVPHSSNAPL